MNSENCICLSCGHYFKPQEIKQWYKNTHACCASDDCGLTGGVLGSASGLDLEDFEECFY